MEPQGHRAQHVGALSGRCHTPCRHTYPQALSGPEPAVVRPRVACRILGLVCSPLITNGRHAACGQHAVGTRLFSRHSRWRLRGRRGYHLDTSQSPLHGRHHIRPQPPQLPVAQKPAACLQAESPRPLLRRHARPDGRPRRAGGTQGYGQGAARYRHAARGAGAPDAANQRHLLPGVRRAIRHHPRGRRDGLLLFFGLGTRQDDQVAERHLDDDFRRRLPPLRATLHPRTVPEDSLHPLPSGRCGCHAPSGRLIRDRRAERHPMDAGGRRTAGRQSQVV